MKRVILVVLLLSILSAIIMASNGKTYYEIALNRIDKKLELIEKHGNKK